MKPTDTSMTGVINPDELYNLSAFKRRLGITSATLRTARRAGLRVFYVHKQGFILGRDWIDYVTSSGPNPSRGQAPSVAPTSSSDRQVENA